MGGCADKAAEGINLLEGTHDHGDEEHKKAEDKVYHYDEYSERINRAFNSYIKRAQSLRSFPFNLPKRVIKYTHFQLFVSAFLIVLLPVQ